jgi:hypothetical protein
MSALIMQIECRLAYLIYGDVYMYIGVNSYKKQPN